MEKKVEFLVYSQKQSIMVEQFSQIGSGNNVHIYFTVYCRAKHRMYITINVNYRFSNAYYTKVPIKCSSFLLIVQIVTEFINRKLPLVSCRSKRLNLEHYLSLVNRKYAENTNADQPVNSCSLISIFLV